LGSAAAWALAARAQQPTLPVIGFLEFPGPGRNPGLDEAFRAGLAAGGFIDGANLSIEYRSAGGDSSRLPDLVADLLGRQVAVIVAVGPVAPALSAKAATSTIPIVFFYSGDPVKDHLVGILNRPGGNITGITASAGNGLDGKRLELLLQLVPQVRKVAFLSGDRSFRFYEQYTTSMLAAGRSLGVEIMIVECSNDRDYEAAVAKMAEGRGWGHDSRQFCSPESQ
jgi:putative ABC transport system substrate-binding protein